MALFGKLLGRKPFAELKAQAEALRSAGEHGRAKLAFEKAADAKDADGADRAAMQAAANACCDALADQRLAEAERLFGEGSQDLAFEELSHALDTAVGEAAVARARAALERAERAQYQQSLAAPAAADEDEETRFATLSGGWEAGQHAEYAGYGEAFRQAFVALHDGDHERARPVLERLAAEAPAPCYLWLDVARARLADNENQAVREALSAFLSAVPDHEGADAKLAAHSALASLRAEADDLEGALEQFEAALDSLGDDPRVYLAMGSFMRVHGMPHEAIEVLQSGLALLEEGQTNFRLWLECGLAHVAAEQPKPAIAYLELVVEHFATRQAVIPEEAAIPLAGLHEAAGQLTRAADLFRAIAETATGPKAVAFHREAARLLEQLGLPDEARRMLLRARDALAALDLPPEDKVELEQELDGALSRR